jgi:hypothetical protein
MLSGILIGGGALALGGYYVMKSRPKNPSPIVVDKNTIITTESSVEIIPTVDKSLIPLLLAAQAEPVTTQNQITKLVVKESVSGNEVSAEAFANLFSPTIPAWLTRAFQPVYLASFYNGANGRAPLFIFKVDSYENGYAGMLRWEQTMGDEFKPFFAKKTASSTQDTIPTTFQDIVIKNKDVRVLVDGSGRRLLLYAFSDPNTIVITTDQAALEEAFARLTTSQFVR